MKGIVKFFNLGKRFGFITGEDEKDYFVHLSALPRNLRLHPGDKVEFETSQREDGRWQAKDVILLEAGPDDYEGGDEGSYQEAPQQE